MIGPIVTVILASAVAAIDSFAKVLGVIAFYAVYQQTESALLTPRNAWAASVTDAAGRNVPVPAKVTRVFPAGPPAAILLYTLAPELLIGWPRANRAEECVYMLPEICTRPELGRITGRGNTANLETVLALKPDLILDVGSTSATFAPNPGTLR